MASCAREVWKSRKQGRRGNQQPGMDLQERIAKWTRILLPKLPNTTLSIVFCRVSNGNNNLISPIVLQTFYTNVRARQYLMDFIEQDGGIIEPFMIT